MDLVFTNDVNVQLVHPFHKHLTKKHHLRRKLYLNLNDMCYIKIFSNV